MNVQGVSGFLSDVGDVEDMARNAIYILEDEQRLESFKNNAYEVAKKFSMDRILPKYEEMYRRVIRNAAKVL